MLRRDRNREGSGASANGTWPRHLVRFMVILGFVALVAVFSASYRSTAAVSFGSPDRGMGVTIAFGGITVLTGDLPMVGIKPPDLSVTKIPIRSKLDFSALFSLPRIVVFSKRITLVCIPLWVPPIACCALLYAIALIPRRSKRKGRCPACGYAMRSANRCPECAWAHDPQSGHAE